jgi:type IV pilus assembly protein PilN
MKIAINLASQPYRRDRPMIAASVAVTLLLVGTLGVLVSLAMIDRTQLADTRRTIEKLNQQIRKANEEQARLDTVLRQPDNAEVLERSVFLNTLLYRKGISWTRIFGDLEKTVPHNVRVISIRPFVNAQNQITLDMVVGSESPEPMIELLKVLADSPLFGPAYLHSSLPPSQNEPLFRYRVSVNYAQKL